MNSIFQRGSVLTLFALVWSCDATTHDLGPDGGSTSSALSAAPLSFTAIADARVEKGSASANFGSSTALKVDSSPVFRSFLRFDVRGVAGAVTSARLRLFVDNGTKDGPAVFATGTSWSESSITWNNQPAATGTAVVDAGALARGGYVELDVTRLVSGNGVIAFVLTGGSSDGLGVTSRETSTPPQLIVVAEGGAVCGDAICTADETCTSCAADCGTCPAPTGASFYVDPAGNDAADGRSQATAWRTTAKASAAPLAPGDQLLFKRGGMFSGGLVVAKSGTATAVITVGAYGTGERPLFRGGSTAVKLTGSYLAVTDLAADDASWAGFDVSGGWVRLERISATRNVVGVQLRVTAHDGAVVHSTVRDNTKMSVLTQGGDDDSGAFGILLHGDRNDIGFNTISGHDAFSYDYGRDGAAIEVYGGQDNHIHHNVAENNDAFTELGDARSRGNIFAHNLVRSSLTGSIFLVTRGAQSSFGPVADTRLYKNTVYLTGSSSQGFVCHAGCGPNILVMRDNVIQAVAKVGYADAVFDDAGGVYFGGPRQFTLGPRSVVADPRFVAAPADLHLQISSPAVDSGVALGYLADLDGVAVPQDGNGDGTAITDRGAYERH